MGWQTAWLVDGRMAGWIDRWKDGWMDTIVPQVSVQASDP